MKTKNLGELWENFNSESLLSILTARKTFNAYQEMPTAAIAAAALNSLSNNPSIGYLCITDTIPVAKLGSVYGLGKSAIDKLPFWKIDPVSHFDYDGDTAGSIKKIGHSMIREQLGFYNALANPYIGDPLGGSLINILDAFKSRLRLIKDNRLDLLKIMERHLNG